MAYYNEYSSSSSKNMKNDSDGFKYVKKFTQILLPLSVISLLFISHSSLAPLFLESYDYLLSNLSFKVKIFTYTTERNCIFLLCNGILVLIIQSSGLISKITPVLNSPPKTAGDQMARIIEESKKKGVEKVEILEEKSSENGGGDFAAEVVEEGFESCEVEKLDEEEEEEEDDDVEIDKEELNRKFEDFIKKVKLEIQSA